MDILDALAQAPARDTTRKCKLQRWLDEIDDSTEGKADLVAVLETRDQLDPAYRPVPQAEKILHRLGLHISIKALGDHRAGRCVCHG